LNFVGKARHRIGLTCGSNAAITAKVAPMARDQMMRLLTLRLYQPPQVVGAASEGVMLTEKMTGICGGWGNGAHLAGPIRVCNRRSQVAGACTCADVPG